MNWVNSLPRPDKVLVRIHRPDPPVDYASPWTAIQPGQALAFTHNLGGDADDLVAGIWLSGTVGISQRAVGGMEVAGSQYGAYWDNLDASRILVNRLPDDQFAQQVRVVVDALRPDRFAKPVGSGHRPWLQTRY